MHEFSPKSELMRLLRQGVHHATSIDSFRSICQSGRIEPNDGKFADSHLQSQCCNARQLGAISLWDFEKPGDSIVFEYVTQMKWSAILLCHHPITVFIAFRRDLLANLVYYKEAKRRCGFGGIIPEVEILHIGSIPLRLAYQIFAVNPQHPNKPQIYQGDNVDFTKIR